MKNHRLLIFCTAVNLAAMFATLLHVNTVSASDIPSVLRAHALQIVDDQGRVRASINVYPASRQKNGETYPETVLLRLITEQGRPSVKLGASEQSALLDLVGPTGTRQTYVQLGAKRTTSFMMLKDEDGRESVTKP